MTSPDVVPVSLPRKSALQRAGDIWGRGWPVAKVVERGLTLLIAMLYHRDERRGWKRRRDLILAGFLVLCLVVAYLGATVWPMARLGISYRQALLYLPFKLAYRIDDRQMRVARVAPAPVLYVISHHSRLDPTLMLALLPADTLHILDEAAARSPWLEPWRELARTIPFNAEHVFVSRRLVRVLKGKGRLAVYLPGDVEPDSKASRLNRAVARIASKADATVVPIWVGGRVRPTDLGSAHAKRSLFPKLAAVVLPPMTIGQLMDQAEARPVTMANALSERIAQTRLVAAT